MPPLPPGDDYAPIDCSLHDRLEAAATLRRVSLIVFEDDDGTRAETHARIDDVFARGGAEFLRTDTGLELRLDRVLAVDGVRYREGPDADA